jgi:trafficking protein particle complex subunit 1
LSSSETMTVHSLHIFDRKGRTLFTKRYAAVSEGENEDPEQLAEQRKLVFGMLFSLREIATSLSPEGTKDTSIHFVKTGASTLYNFESNSGLRFSLYMSNNKKTHDSAKSIRTALQHIYNDLWINNVTRSPVYIPTAPNVASTSFEQNLDAFFAAQTWFK